MADISQNLGTLAVGTNNLITTSTGSFAGITPGTIIQPDGSLEESKLNGVVYMTTPSIPYNVGDPMLTLGTALSISGTAGGPLDLHDVYVYVLVQVVHVNPLDLPPGYVVNAPQNMIVNNLYIPEPSTLVLAAVGSIGVF